MLDYLHFFFEDIRQIFVFLAVIIVWLGLAALGGTLTRASEDRVLYPLLGWGIVTIAFTFIGTLTDIAFTMIAGALAFCAVIAAGFLIKRDKWLLDPSFLKMLVWATPLLLLVSAMRGSQWDEFSHWLLGQKYLLQVDHFPGDGRPSSAASYPAYPYAWQLLSYLVGRIYGGIVENSGPLLNLLLLMTLGRLAVTQALRVAGRTEADTTSPWLIASLALAAATIFNPTFVQKVILTAYADAATSVTLAVSILIGWSMLEALADDDLARARKRALLSGLVLAILISLKQSTLELFALGLGAVFLVGLIHPRIRLIQLVQCSILMALPGILVYGAWRYYVATQLQGREFKIHPFAQWNFALLPTILFNMGYVLLKKSAYLAAMLIATAVGVRSLFSAPTVYGRAMLTIALVFLGHTVFLTFCYVAVFQGYEARTIASYWRYNQQLGGLAVLVFAMSAGVLVHRYHNSLILQKLKWLPAVVLVFAPFIFAEKVRFDASPVYGHYRMVGAEVASRITPNAKVMVLDPKGSGESGIILRYEISDITQHTSYQAAFHDMSAAALGEYWARVTDEYVVIHSVTPALTQAFGPELEDRNSYLIRKSPSGSVEIIASWPWPAGS